MQLETIIGLEIHVQLKTKSKMFCSCSNSGENEKPNTTVCPVCLGHPGTLPVPNGKAIEWSAMAALALNCSIPKHSKFDRKHYFYPDLPKGYQISQYDEPIGQKGFLEITHNGNVKKIRLHRLHLEEDAAKLLHSGKGDSYVDYNRGGTPLMEIVTEADIRTPEEAGAFLRELRMIMRYLGASDADMEKGHLRCDANISLRPFPESPPLEGGDTEDVFYPKTEIKNLNSFKAVEKALAYEIIRQTKVWNETGTAPTEQGTRGWNELEAKTTIQRTKEDAHDYRYFPEPDIPELHFDDAWVAEIKNRIPELPAGLRKRFIEEYGFSGADAQTFAQDTLFAHYAEHVISELKNWLTSNDTEATAEEIWEKHKEKLSRLTATWLLSKLLGLMYAQSVGIVDLPITAENMAELITMVFENKVNGTNAQKILDIMFTKGGDPSDILAQHDLGAMEDAKALVAVIDAVIANSAEQVAQYKAGKVALFQYFVGQAMKETRGKADAAQVSELLKKKLGGG